jgi:hypothetical protein
VTAGTIMHGTHLPLRTWFIAAHLVATHSNGISALQLQGKLGIGSYKAAWLLLHKLRKSMVDSDRDPLAGMVEVDETSIAFRTKDDPVAGGQGRGHDGKILIVGAVESIEGGKAGRIRLPLIGDYRGKTLKDFIAADTALGSTILTDGFSSYPGMNERHHMPKVVGTMAAHVLLPWIHRVFSNLKRHSRGVLCGHPVIAVGARSSDSAAIRARLPGDSHHRSSAMMTQFVGLDVSQKMTAICVVDNAGRRVWRGQCPTAPEQIAAMVRPSVPTMLRQSPAGSLPLRAEVETSHGYAPYH